MITIPEKIHSMMSRNDCTKYVNGIRTDFYLINGGEETETKLQIPVPYKFMHTISNNIVWESPNHRFLTRLVRFDDGTFGYRKEWNNEVLFQRYDVATDFNEYGFAMVAKDNFVTWINKEFKLLDVSGLFFHVTTPAEYKHALDTVMDAEAYYKNPNEYQGYFHDNGSWRKVDDFSKGAIPLSRLQGTTYYQREQAAYLGTNGKLVEFREHDGKKYTGKKETYFSHGTEFDEAGHAYSHDGMLFAEGFYIRYDNLKEWFTKKGYADVLRDQVIRRRPKKLLNESKEKKNKD